jgi:FKBP-type peptidyl-prolyl cis-trans isomerase (trigger factor)
MKKISTRILALILMLAALLPTIASCSREKYTVEFYVDGKLYHTVEADTKNPITFPAVPTKEGYVFESWFCDTTYQEVFTEDYLCKTEAPKDMKVEAAFVIDQSAKIDFYGDLSEYATLSREDYLGLLVTDTTDPVLSRDVEMEILKLLTKKKGQLVSNDNLNVTLGAGDKVSLKYRGFTYDDSGHRNYFNGGCNFKDTAYTLELGSGAFIVGFEIGLVGKNPTEYATLTELTEGTVTAGDTVYITYDFSKNGEAYTTKSLLVDLSATNIGAEYGEGFLAFITGSSIGDTLAKSSQSFAAGSDTIEYKNVKINKVFRPTGNEILIVEAYFPKNYSEESLRGKTAYFECFISSVQDYESPVFDNAFVTEKLGVTAEELASFEGDSIAEKYRAQILKNLEDAKAKELDNIKGQELLNLIAEKIQIKKYPMADLYQAYEDMMSGIYSNYQSYAKYYTFEQFVVLYYGLPSDTDPYDFVLEKAKDYIKQKLGFHIAAGIEGISLTPEDRFAKGNAMLEEYLLAVLDQSGIYRENFDTEAKYEAKANEYRNKLIEYYGKEYFEYEAFCEYAMAELIKLVGVKVD